MKNNNNLSPFVETRNLSEIIDRTGNLYEAINIIAKRSNQLNVKLKEELHNKLAEFAVTSDNLEEVFENREQIEISKFYEKMPNSVLKALDEYMEDKVYYRKPSDEEAEEQTNEG
jgi:DNA-directed RNA polymerase subunit K/omega